MNRILVFALMLVWGMAGMTIPARAQGTSGCPGPLETRLTPEGLGRALEVSVEVVDEPASDGAQPQILPAGSLFAVLDGPVCEEETAWWQIEYDAGVDAKGRPIHRTGWIYEWLEGDYVVEPLPDVTRTYVAPDASITFLYPEAYQVVVDTRDLVLLSNSASGSFEPGSVMLGVYKSAYAVESLMGSTGTPLELLAIDAAAGADQGVTYGEPTPVTLGANEAAYTFTTSPGMGMDGTIAIVGYGEADAASMLIGMTVPGEAALGTAVVMAVGRTLHAADTDLLAETLTQEFALADGSFGLNMREGWLAEQSEDIVIVVNSPTVYSLSSLDDLVAGQIIVFVYPTVATIEAYPADTLTGNEAPSTIVSFLASMGMVTGYTADGPMTMDLSAGTHAAASWFAHAQAHDRLVITAENGQGDFVTFDAYAAPGELFHFEPTLLAMLATVSAD